MFIFFILERPFPDHDSFMGYGCSFDNLWVYHLLRHKNCKTLETKLGHDDGKNEKTPNTVDYHTWSTSKHFMLTLCSLGNSSDDLGSDSSAYDPQLYVVRPQRSSSRSCLHQYGFVGGRIESIVRDFSGHTLSRCYYRKKKARKVETYDYQMA